MMLYEAVHLQHTEHYYDYYSSPTKMKQPERVNYNNNSNNNINNRSVIGVQRTKSFSGVAPKYLSPQQQQNLDVSSRRGSYVVGQKLRESKWFAHDELRVFLAVVETGFIVQQRNGDDEEAIEYGVAVWNVGEEKSKSADQLKVYTLQSHKNNFRVVCLDLMEFWPPDTKLRIFNQCDKTKAAHSEDVIRSQIHYAETTKQKWHNTEHFTYWCRYGPIQISQRVRSMTDAKWGNFNAGFSQIKKRIRRITNGK